MKERLLLLSPWLVIKERFLLLSPWLVLVVGHAAARIAAHYIGTWAWVPLALVYWGLLGGLIVWGNGKDARKRWFSPPRGPRRWSVVAVAVGFITLPILILNRHLLADPTIFVLWILFALINPWFEEGYWRGLLLDAAAEAQWPRSLSTAYTTVLFAASHPLMWGVFSIANRDWMPLVALLLMGMAWSTAYHHTGTLRWAIVGHVIVDLGNLAVPVFLNLYIPPHLL